MRKKVQGFHYQWFCGHSGGGDNMYVNIRMEKPLGWYPGPFVIGLASIASDVGCDVDWFERIMSEQPHVDRHERLVSMAFVQSLCDKVGQLRTIILSEGTQRQAGQQSASLVGLSLGEPTLKAVLTRTAAMTLLNTNLFTYRFESLPARKAYSISLLPIIPIPWWLHLCFTHQFSVGLASRAAFSDIEIEEVVLGGARVAQRSDLSALTDAVLSTTIVSDSAPSRVIYKAKSLDQANRFANKPWRNMTNSLVNPLISSRLKAQPWTYRCYMMILKHFDAGLSLSMEAISNSLGADVSTLRRYLQVEETGFKPLVTLFRNQQAQLMMIDGVSIERMAERLDFKSVVSVKRLCRAGLIGCKAIPALK
jgi:AraC-like DNA-binding protein